MTKLIQTLLVFLICLGTAITVFIVDDLDQKLSIALFLFYLYAILSTSNVHTQTNLTAKPPIVSSFQFTEIQMPCHF
jgi:hypothetical protein